MHTQKLKTKTKNLKKTNTKQNKTNNNNEKNPIISKLLENLIVK